MKNVYEKLMSFKSRHPNSLGFRLQKQAQELESNLLDDEELIDVYCGLDVDYKTWLVAITDRRVILVRKKLLWGSICDSIELDQICKVNTSKGLIWGSISFRTLTGSFAYLNHISNDGIEEVKKSAIKAIMKKKKAEKEKIERVEREERLQPIYNNQNEQYLQYQQMQNDFISRQIELCKQLDAVYRERYRIENSPEVKEEIRLKAIENYNLYMNLTGQNLQYIQQPQMRLLNQKKTNIC